MAFGISLYSGLDNTKDENRHLLSLAKRAGVSFVFTSLHIPESASASFEKGAGAMMSDIREAGLSVVADVSPGSLAKLRDLFHETDILRLDDGFSTDDVASLSLAGRRVFLNASTTNDGFLAELSQKGADFSAIGALHNFYPRKNTGLSSAFFQSRAQLFHEYGIRVGAFVPSSEGRRRAPFHEGLPTVELHRNFSVDLAARHLAALGADDIFIGDSLPTSSELDALTGIRFHHVRMRARRLTHDEGVTALLENEFTARPDESRDVIRAIEGRALAKNLTVTPENTIKRPKGTITVDNSSYLRYAGEVQIALRPLPPDERVNVAAMVRPEELFMIKLIKPGGSFSFSFD